MDPQATLYDLLDAIDRNDREAISNLLAALKDWNDRNGFLPKVIKINQFDGLFQVRRNG